MFRVEPQYLKRKSKTKHSWTVRELIEEIESESEFGNNFVDMLIMLSMDIFDRQKEQVKDVERVTNTN